MSLLNSASLVVTPNAYKEGTLYSVIPNTTLGDMTVVRATTATRVNSAGLIELVPYNFIVYSEQFNNAAWTAAAFNATVTANTTIAPNGTLTADTVVFGASGYLYEQFTITGLGSATFSIYSKSATQIIIFGGGTPAGTDVYTSINVGNGWFRQILTRTFTSGGTGILQPLPFGNNVTAFLWGAQLVVGSSAKDYFPTTDRLNVPRLDYLNASCPSLLVEPQRTNSVLYSEDFTNVNWIPLNTTITTNATTSPDGNTTADKIIASAVSGDKLIYQLLVTTIGATYTTTVYFKSAQYTQAFIRLGGISSNPYVIYNLSTQAIVSTTGLTSSSITSMGNGWYKVTATAVATGGIVAPNIMMLPATGYTLGGDNIPEFTGNGSDGGFIWGAQFEAGSYPTSYIPTTSAAVTRNADLISKTGISSLIGQTEGTMFVDAVLTGKDSTNGSILFATDKVSTGAIIRVFYTSGNALRFDVFNGTSFQCLISAGAYNVGDRVKVAGGYKNNDFVMYVNGTQIGTDTSGTVPATDTANINTSIYGDTNGSRINSAILFPTRLTNAELAQLTTI